MTVKLFFSAMTRSFIQ